MPDDLPKVHGPDLQKPGLPLHLHQGKQVKQGAHHPPQGGPH